MALEVGMLLEGKVTGVTKFGAFVSLPDNKSGMVHISEVSTSYVKEISDHVKVGQTVKVKVLKIDENNKISLSMKKAEPRPEPQRRSAPEFDWNAKKNEGLSFEDKLSKFKQDSDEKMLDLKRYMDSKRGGFARRGSASKN
jgi:S1 RNA binding domain protein